MDKTIKFKVASLFRSSLILSIITMVSGRVAFFVYPNLGKAVAYTGAYLLIACPLIGLGLLVTTGRKEKRKRIYIPALAILLFIALTLVCFLYLLR